MRAFKKGSPRLIRAWAFYDWANSVYPLVISTAVFPIYYSTMANSFANDDGDISFLGMFWNPTTLYDYTLSISFLIVAFCSPILSAIADYTGNKLKFLKAFCLLGALSVMALFFFKGESTLWVALVFTILAMKKPRLNFHLQPKQIAQECNTFQKHHRQLQLRIQVL